MAEPERKHCTAVTKNGPENDLAWRQPQPQGWNAASPGADFPSSRDSTSFLATTLKVNDAELEAAPKGQPCSSMRHKRARVRSLACVLNQ